MRLNRLFVTIALVFTISSSVTADFAMPEMIPGQRIIDNITAALAEKPDDPQLYYNLGRTHYLMFFNKAYEVGAFERNSLLEPADNFLQGNYISRMRRERAQQKALKQMGLGSIRDIIHENSSEYYKLDSQIYEQLRKENWLPPQLPDSEIITHASSAMENFNKAIALDPNNSLYHLGLGCLIEQYVDYLEEINSELVPEQFRKVILDSARQSYLTAYELSIKKDLKLKYLPISGLSGIISQEAGSYYIKLAKEKQELTKSEQKTLEQIERNIDKLKKLPRGAITPIIFTFRNNTILNDLLLDDIKIPFDLDGDDFIEERPWITPETALLVWDPQNTGKITSGRQLFGSVSWRLFFGNGYQALNLLDDNRDGILSGNELDGISAWFDANSDGISNLGEVLPVCEIGIMEISTTFTDYENGCPKNPKGIRTKDKFIATYDWIVSD